MKRKIYSLFLGILIISIPLNVFGILNTMVSLKYETENPKDCISRISGDDLCTAIIRMKAMIVIALVLIYLLLYFKNRILKTQKK